MRFSTEIHEAHVEQYVRSLLSITGVSAWQKKLEAMSHQRRQNLFLEHWQRDRHPLETTLAEVMTESEAKGNFPTHISDGGRYKLFVFAATICRIFEGLSAKGQKRLRGMLIKGLQPDDSLLSLLHETVTAAHLVSRGFDLEFADLDCDDGGVDFIARKEGIELEAECKMFTGDLGRKIHNRKAIHLAKHLESTINRVYRSAATGIFVRVTIPDRLMCSESQLRDIDDAFSKGVLSGRLEAEACTVEVADFDIAASPFNIAGIEHLSRPKIDDFVRGHWGASNEQMVIAFSKSRAMIVLVQSMRPDRVLLGVYRQLRESAKQQFSRTRPGFLFVQFQDLSSRQMEELAKDDSSHWDTAHGLQRMTSNFLASESRSHIHGVAYRSHGALTRSAEESTVVEAGVTYIIKNHVATHSGIPLIRHLFETQSQSRIVLT